MQKLWFVALSPKCLSQIHVVKAEVGEKADTQAASKSPGKNAGKGKKRTSDAPSKDVPKKKPRIAKKKDDKTADVRSLIFLYALFLILVQKTTKGKGKVSKQVASPVRVSLFYPLTASTHICFSGSSASRR